MVYNPDNRNRRDTMGEHAVVREGLIPTVGQARGVLKMARKSVPQVAKHTLTASIDRLSPPADRDRVDLDLSDFFEETRRGYAANPHLKPLYGHLAEFVLRGGKRLRPRLCLASYRILTGRFEPPPSPVARAAASLEVFHAFMLVHDDLIDGSVLRRNRPTLHEAIRRDAEQPDDPLERKRASDLGLIAGDLLFALGMRLLGRSGLDDATLGRANRLVADMLFETGLGEALDVLYDDCPLQHLTEEQIVESYLRKTARYSVSGPLVLGASIAGAPPAITRALDRFGDLLGFGFQVQNDLDALEEDPELGDQPDLDAGKRTYVLWATYQGLGDRGRRKLKEVMARPVGSDRRRLLLGLIAESGAVQACQARLDTVRCEAIEVLREAPLDTVQRRQFVALTELFQAPQVLEAPGFIVLPIEADGVPMPEGGMVDA
ncbi:polyprenyl synthetase family protein [Tundrisphaera lichenicola]|uniref:polyprenyl synthetase family protein n=1 Tax=Tundrisphaera lichenicola TaxID=2029860 RepID=UPI003EBAF50F